MSLGYEQLCYKGRAGSLTYDQAITRRGSFQSMTASCYGKINTHLSDIPDTLNNVMFILNVYNNGL